jgi:hypothetical protein
MQFTITSHEWENFFFDRSWFRFDSVENFRVENVDSRVDSVADEFGWLLNEPLNVTTAGCADNDAIFGWFFNFSDLKQ